MAITYVDSVQPALETVNATTHSITSPAGVLAGDFLLLFMSHAGSGVTNSRTTNPIGFVKLGDATPSTGVTSTVKVAPNVALARDGVTVALLPSVAKSLLSVVVIL